MANGLIIRTECLEPRDSRKVLAGFRFLEVEARFPDRT
jgi:hypothetical protein